MLTKTPHLFDEATAVTAGDSRWQGRTSPDYWAFVGPFGGCTAATILRALMQHPQRAGDPLALTVNYCAPVAEGVFDLDVRLVKANRSSQHWSVEMTQGGGEVTTLATAVFAERRPSWSHQPAQFPGAVPFEQLRPYPKLAMTWPNQYDFRFAEGEGRNFADMQAAETFRFTPFFHALLDNGIYVAPSPFETWFVSDALTDADFELIEAALKPAAQAAAAARPAH